MITELRLLLTARLVKIGDTIDFSMETDFEPVRVTFTVIAITSKYKAVLFADDTIVLAEYLPNKHRWCISRRIDLLDTQVNLIVEELAPLNNKTNK